MRSRITQPRTKKTQLAIVATQFILCIGYDKQSLRSFTNVNPIQYCVAYI